MKNIEEFGLQPTKEATAAVAEPQPQTEKNESQFLDFETQKVQAITLDQLRRTNRENRGDDRSAPHGIYHFALIDRIISLCAERNLITDVFDLFATNNRDKQTPGVSLYPDLEAQYGERAVEATTLRRVFANIRITNFDAEGLTMNLAVSYTQRGIQIGYGTNVIACHNQNMLGEGLFVSDFKATNHYAADPQKCTLDAMLRTVGVWLDNSEVIFQEDKKNIAAMKKAVLTPEDIYLLLGLLLGHRVLADTTEKSIRQSNIIYPLNQAQLVRFTTSLLMQAKERKKITAWVFYNTATELYKPATCEQNLILPQNLALYKFMKEYEVF